MTDHYDVISYLGGRLGLSAVAHQNGTARLDLTGLLHSPSALVRVPLFLLALLALRALPALLGLRANGSGRRWPRAAAPRRAWPGRGPGRDGACTGTAPDVTRHAPARAVNVLG